MTEALKALAANIVSRHQSGADPYMLFLGAGASISSRCSSMLAIADDLLRSHDSAQLSSWDHEIAKAEKLDATFGQLQRAAINVKKVGRFLEIWATQDSDTKFAFLRRHLLNGKVPSSGYDDLAYLVKAGLFTTILTTNLDALMEKALIAAGLIQPENFIVVVNRKDSPAEVADQLEHSRAPIKIVKLHGTLESPRSYAFTPEEIFSFEKTIRPSLTRILNQSLVVVGHSMQDRDINILLEEDGKEIHFVNPSEPQRGSAIENVLAVRTMGSVISGADATFDNFFQNLRREVETLSRGTVKSDSGSTIEVFLRGLGLEGELKAPRSRYKNLDTLYVRPTEYDDIVSKLENDHLVFIIGEPHMGKTYSALYLLWQYHQKGYETIHLRHDDLIHRIHTHDEDLRKLLLELYAPTNLRPRIVHFDDPFGETAERRTEVIAEKIDMFVEMAQSYEHLRVIVTSRLNIFNEALVGNTDAKLQNLEKTLRVHTSYRREVILDILHRYVDFYKPAWANDERIVKELDDKLPSMLPAPHNIEFFVRTSEMLNSSDDVLMHVEESKKMVSALAGWMKHMASHEQIFLMWVEVCSTASILFAGTPAADIDIEKAFTANLAYSFTNGELPGIPTMPFSSSRDKFETILIERRDDRENRPTRFDFVHPSYHEAFWYAVRMRFPIVRWWESLYTHVGLILRDLNYKVDLVQLKMIERYGTINRDLDQLLLLSAVSQDPNEQLIALEHMLKRPEQFASVPQFTVCLDSIVSQHDPSVRIGMLDLYERLFDQLPPDAVRIALPLLLDHDKSVRLKAKHVIGDRISILPPSFFQEKAVQDWQLVRKITSSISPPPEDSIDYLSFLSYVAGDTKTQLSREFCQLTPLEIGQLFQIQPRFAREGVFFLFSAAWDDLSNEQRRVIALRETVEDQNQDLRSLIEEFISDHPSTFRDLKDQYSALQDLHTIQTKFRLPLTDDIRSAFFGLPITNWPDLAPSDIRDLSLIASGNVGKVITTLILENNDLLTEEKRQLYLDALFSPDCVPSLIEYIASMGQGEETRRLYPRLSESVLMRLISAVGRVQYEVLTSLLLRFETLSEGGRSTVLDLVSEPPDWWVGGSVGQLCTKKYSSQISETVRTFPWQIAKSERRNVSGAMLSEFVQAFFDPEIGLAEDYQPLMYLLLKEEEVVRYAESWMDHSAMALHFVTEEYWTDLKNKLRAL